MIDRMTLAEWENYQKTLAFETEKIKSQLAYVEQRQTDIKWGVWISFGLLLLPFLLSLLANILCRFAATQTDVRIAIVLSLAYGLRSGLWLLAVLLLPLNLISLYRSIRKHLRHNPATVQWNPPSIRISSLNRGITQEPNCEVEKQKLLWVLSRYKFYNRNIDSINEKINLHSDKIDDETIKKYMKDMPLYEEIRPARR